MYTAKLPRVGSKYQKQFNMAAMVLKGTRRQNLSRRHDRFAINSLGWWAKRERADDQWLPRCLVARSLSSSNSTRGDG